MKNKKLLLVAVAAMGLVAAATAGVGTAAWYQATNSAQVTSAVTGSLSSATSTLSGDVTFTVAVTEKSSGSLTNLNLTDNTGATFVRGKDGNPIPASGTKKRGLGVATITASAASTDIVKANAGSYSIRLSAASQTNDSVYGALTTDASSRVRMTLSATEANAYSSTYNYVDLVVYLTDEGKISTVSATDHAGTAVAIGTGVAFDFYCSIDGANPNSVADIAVSGTFSAAFTPAP